MTLGNLIKPLATINLPESLTFLVNFCKGVIIYHFWATFIDTLDTSNSTFVAIIFNKKEEEDGSEDHLTTFGQFGVFNYTTDVINTLAEEKDSSFQRNNNNDCRYLQPFKMLSLIETQRSVACTFLFFTFQPIYMLAKRKIGRKYFIQIIFPSRN